MAKILVIDDEPEIRRITRKLLESAGHKVLEAEDGEAGLEMLEKEKPDVILLDIMLPGIDGWEVCNRIKANNNLRDIPIAMFTVKDGDEDVLKSIQCNADLHITKPFENYILLDAVNALLENRAHLIN